MINADVAIERMIARHEFLRFEHRYGQVRVRCYCGEVTALYVSESTAQTAHKRHQDKALAMPDAKKARGGM